MLSRRLFVAGSALATLAGGLPAAAEPVLNDDGLYTEPWFVESFLELADDVATAAKGGKRLAVMWEQRGCPFCRETHLVNLARADIADYIKTRFDVIQLNIYGSREITDFDREKLAEKAFAAKYGVRFTPTFQFFPDNAAGLDKKPPRQREVLRSQGYLLPDDFKRMFTFVAERAYEREPLRDYLRKQS